MKFLLKVLVLVSLIVIQKFTKEEPITLGDQLTNPTGIPVYSHDSESGHFPESVQVLQPKTNSRFVRFN